MLVVFENKEELDLFGNYFELKEKLEQLLGRNVDLVVDKKFRNPYFQKALDGTKISVYER